MTNGSLSLTSYRWIWSIIMGILGLVGGFAPLCLRVNPTLNSILNLAAGGVFLAGSLIHLLPDAVNNEALRCWMCMVDESATRDADDYGSSCCGDGDPFPWSFLFFGIGFLLILLLETMTHALQQNHTMNSNNGHNIISKKKHGHHHDSNDTQEKQLHEQQHYNAFDSEQPANKISTKGNGPPRSHDAVNENFPLILNTNTCSHENTIDSMRENLVAHAHISGLLNPQSGSEDANDSNDRNFRDLIAFVVFLALSFHSIMEGIGMGSQLNVTEGWDIFWAIAAHKILAGFALGQEFLSHGVSRQTYFFSIVIFAIMTPIGVALGEWITSRWHNDNDGATESLSSGICTSLAGGTFLYVAVMEIIPQELQNKEYLLAKSLALLGGFGGFGLLAKWV